MKITEISNTIPLPQVFLSRCYGNNDFTQIIAQRCPVFLVDEELMDKLYPPRRKRVYNVDCLSDKLKGTIDELGSTNESQDRYDSDPEAIENLAARFWNSAESCLSSGTELHYLCGLYLSTLSDKNRELLEGTEAKEAIVLCPERIQSWSEASLLPGMNGDDGFLSLSTAVWRHEAAHAWLGTDPRIYNTPWGYIIEESMANAFALNTLVEIEHPFLRHAAGKQAFPYCAFSYWRSCSEELLSPWRDYWCAENIPQSYGRSRTYLRRRTNNLDFFEELIADFMRISPRKGKKISPKSFWQLIAMSLIHWYKK